MYRIQLVGKLKGGQSVDLIFVGLTSYLQITPTTGFTAIFKATFFLDSPDWAQLEVQVGEQEY